MSRACLGERIPCLFLTGFCFPLFQKSDALRRGLAYLSQSLPGSQLFVLFKHQDCLSSPGEVNGKCQQSEQDFAKCRGRENRWRGAVGTGTEGPHSLCPVLSCFHFIRQVGPSFCLCYQIPCLCHSCSWMGCSPSSTIQ